MMLPAFKRIFRWLACVILTISYSENSHAQELDLRALHERSTDLLTSGSSQKMEFFLDSLDHLARSEPLYRTAHRLMSARWMRHTGKLQEAYLLLDSLREALSPSDHYQAYLVHYQIAKTLNELAVYDRARDGAHVARNKATLAGLHEQAREMEILACEIDLNGDHFHEAQLCFEVVLLSARKRNDHESASIALIGLGNIHYFQENDKEALLYYDQAFAEARVHGDQGLLVSALLNIGAAVTYIHGPDSAIALYRTVLDTMHTAPLGKRNRADILGNMASMYSDLGQDEKAANLIDSALNLYGEIRDTASMAHAHLFKATALWNLERHDAALEQARLSLARGPSIDLKAKATQKMAEILRVTGRPAESLEMMFQYTTLADSISRMRYNVGLAGAQVRFATAEKERHIVLQQQALERATAESRRKAFQRNTLIGSTLLLALIATLLVRAMRNRQRLANKEKELHDEQVDQLLSQQEIKSINAMLEGQEKERDRVAKDLHDRLGSMLGGIKANMNALEDRVEQMQQDAQYQKVNRLLDQTVSELRQISHDMAAATLSRFGLEKALADLRDTIHINGRLSVELNTFGLDQRLERSVELAIYRIVQELVSNVLKHAKAHELSIAVTRSPGRLSLMVSDDGVGFDTTQPAEGIGHANIRSRASALGATVQVDSAPGKGTSVSVECPVVE